MSRLHRVTAALASAALVGTAGAQAPAVSSSPIPGAVGIDGVVAVVGNTPILRTDVEERIGAMRTQGQPMPTDSAGQRALVKQIIDQLIDEDLLVQKAQALKLEVADNDITPDVDKQMSQIRSRFSTEQEFRTELRKAGFGTPDEYRRWLLDQARRSKLQQKLFDQLRQDNKLTALPVSEAEVTDFFEKNKGQLQKLPATVTLRQIVISPKPSAKHDSAALAKADSIYAELRRGGDFALIAKRESMDPGTKDLGGDLGWHRRGDFVPEFDRIYFAMPPGQISPPFKTSFGYHILKIDRVQPAEVKGRHILIRPEIDSADVAAARQEAELVAKQWRAGANFDSLVAKHHDPAEEKTIPTPFPQAQLPQEYQTAIAGHKAGDVLEPFSIVDKSTGRPKFFVVQLTTVAAEHEPSVADWRERIRDQLGQEKAIRRYLDNLRKETYVSVRM